VKRIVFLIALVLMFASVTNAGDTPGSLNLIVNDKFELVDGTGKRLADYKGKVFLLNFWASWCGPCFMEIPQLNKTHEKYKSKGLEVISLSVESQLGLTKIDQIGKKAKMAYTIGRANEKMVQELKIFAIPISFLFGRDGKLVSRYMGPPPPGKLDEDIQSALAK
jgi:thiol-disulfide isomerase/thioredoxin